ncbi:hypothetical protein A0H81_11178 [Grifola frondosa]|uniref:Uncharacterized protein n=1 Tax=Grifola frondosa TaxID=5627 RepID=A0A1C7LXZ7_GRIFR|nr:hypothetical protein A0H81_11178 [Grifola frondosa]
MTGGKRWGASPSSVSPRSPNSVANHINSTITGRKARHRHFSPRYFGRPRLWSYRAVYYMILIAARAV